MGLCSLGLIGSPLSAAEPLHQQIDKLIAAKTPGYEKLAAPLTTDEEFVRRVALDLTGMIPTAKEVRAFVADKSSGKRTKLIDRLLNTPEYARHMQRLFDVMLMRRLPQKNVPNTEWEKYLRDSFAANKPYDKLVREILSNDGTDLKNRAPAKFYLDRNGNVDDLTKDIARIFLGADLECAQCHNHPEIEDYKQEFYYGLSAFLVRSYVFTDRKKKKAILAEKAIGEVKFESVFDIRDKKSKGPKSTLPKVFGLTTSAEPKFKKGQEYKVKPTKAAGGVPKYSRRSLLPELVTSSNNERFARTAVNRLWATFLGRGLVHPLDRDHSGNPPSHPKLLKLLTDEFRAHGHDIKWLVRELMLSKTYQRSSRLKKGATPQPEETFTQAILRPLTPAQFAWSVLQATGTTDIHRKSLGAKATEELLHKRLVGYENRFVALFGGRPGQPPESFQSTVDQVLFLSNDPMFNRLIAPQTGNLADRLAKLPANQPEKIAEELFLSVLSRSATKQDVADVASYLKNVDKKKRPAAIQELIWAVVTSSEFRFNH
ncbi:MAG: DUF1549 domain-containing protein [Planctomycetaceae bacterium]